MFNPEQRELAKPKINLNTYYTFDVNPDFSRSVPQIVTKQPGKFHKHPVFSGIKTQDVNELAEIMERNSKRRELMAMFNTAR